MNPGRIGADALRYWEARQASVSNNLANVSTPGFKGDRVFARMLDDSSVVTESAADLTGGSLTGTGRPLDVALTGDGFLVVGTPEGPRWSRGGSLSLAVDGTLVDAAGNAVFGEGGDGPLVLPPGTVEIARDGAIRVDGAEVARLRLEVPRDPSTLVRAGATQWMRPEDADPAGPEQVQVHQGHIEESNVDPVGAMVEMIEIQRAYSAVQRSMQTVDGVRETITNRIGRVGG